MSRNTRLLEDVKVRSDSTLKMLKMVQDSLSLWNPVSDGSQFEDDNDAEDPSYEPRPGFHGVESKGEHAVEAHEAKAHDDDFEDVDENDEDSDEDDDEDATGAEDDEEEAEAEEEASALKREAATSLGSMAYRIVGG
jgi:hypothetical protein